MDDAKLHEIQQQVKNDSVFLKETTLPIKKQYAEDIKEYIEAFITFPGGAAIATIIFTSSDIVVNKISAIIGSLFIFSSLFICLYLYLKSIIDDQTFYEDILKTELPMVKLSRALTKFSRNKTAGNEDELIKIYQGLQSSYYESSEEDFDEAQKLRIKKMKDIINRLQICFWLLIFGFIFFLLSALPKNFFYELQNKNHVLEGNGIYFFYQIP
jgi:hypothetical protein